MKNDDTNMIKAKRTGRSRSRPSSKLISTYAVLNGSFIWLSSPLRLKRLCRDAALGEVLKRRAAGVLLFLLCWYLGLQPGV